jgi:hypothetical protein
VLLCTIGGLLGLLVGYAYARVIPSALSWPMASSRIACGNTHLVDEAQCGQQIDLRLVVTDGFCQGIVSD